MSLQANEQLSRARQDKRRKYLTVIATEIYNDVLTEDGWENIHIEENFDHIIRYSLSIAKIIMEESTWEAEMPPVNDFGVAQRIFGKAEEVYQQVVDRIEGRNNNTPKRAAEKMENFKDGVKTALLKSEWCQIRYFI